MVKKKLYKIAYGGSKIGFGVVDGFLNVMAKNRKSAEQQVRRKTKKGVYNI